MILDTNALSAFADGVTPVVQQIAAGDELHIPVIVLGEYRFGIATSRRRREYEAWLARGRALWNVLPLVEETATHYALIRQQPKNVSASRPLRLRSGQAPPTRELRKLSRARPRVLLHATSASARRRVSGSADHSGADRTSGRAGAAQE